MTETARRLRRLGAPHARARAFAVVLGGLGAALAAAALGLALAPAVSGVTLAWVLIVASAAAATWAVRRARRAAAAAVLGRLIENAAGGRAGSIVGVVGATAGEGSGSSAALLHAADTRAAAVVSVAAPSVNGLLRRTTYRHVATGAGAALMGVLLFLAGSPASGRAAAFWHPVRTWRDAHAPVRLVVDRRMVRRGGSVTATITVPGATRVTLWTRGRGEPWKALLLSLDTDGHVVRHLGPIESDLYLRALSADGSPLEGATPELHLVIVPDSAPVVTVPVPGRDTTLPISLHEQLVADVRDDHGISRLSVVSWRVSRTGRIGEAVRESLDVSGVGDRAIVQARLDAEHRGLLPGDTLRFYVEALDNAPTPHVGRSPEIALRLPSMEELRAEARAAARSAANAADSVSAAQRELSDRTRDLAEERSRDSDGRASARPGSNQQQGAMSFQSTQRAEEIARDQAAVSQRVQELAQAVEEIARAAKAAGIDDSAFQNRLREVQELMERALTPELEQRLRELQEALARLDPEATRQALQRLAEAQQQLRRELERSEELFKRAAIEGELASLAKDAEDLLRRQAEWTKADAQHPDSAAAAAERDLATATDSLAKGVERAGQTLPLERSQAAARRAQRAMQEAADAASRRNARQARTSGQEAADSLAQLPDALRHRRDSLTSAWRQETVDALNRALAGMAQAQQGMTGDAQGLLPMMGAGGEAMMQRLRELAGRQRALAEQLERLQAGGDASAAGALAQEARELARQLEAGRLDARTIARQERLYRKLLDAGRSLTGDEPDEQKERPSRSATAADSVHIPAALRPGATGTGPRVRYPTWDELSGLTPEQRRLVLEYFRRLNETKH